MPQTKAILRPDLGALAYEYSLGAASQGFIAQQVLPPFFTPLKSAQYPVIPAEALLEDVDTRRAPRAAYARGDWDFEFLDFNCSENGYEEPVDDSEAQMFRAYFDAETMATYRAMGIILRRLEKRVAAKIFSPATFGGGHAVGAAWNSYDDADPRGDVVKGREAIRLSTGLKPNALILDESVLLHVSMCNSVIERVKYSDPNAIRGDLTIPQLEAYFGCRVIVAGAVGNKAAKGKDKAVSPIWSSTMAMLGVVSSGGQDLREPSLGRIFSWEEDAPEMLVVETYREEQTRSNVVRARQNTDECIQFTGAGYLMTGVTV
ncbi:MAG TPA: hypothetical protein PKC79_18070 [Solidesulfovibrio magneticus]|nr:hypothetical protein [Solidesulfovibrio magneticus]